MSPWNPGRGNGRLNRCDPGSVKADPASSSLASHQLSLFTGLARLCYTALAEMLDRSKLDVYQTEITALLQIGATKTWIAGKYGTTCRNLSHWIKQHGIVES
jgi:hypothetical protein